MFLLRMAWRNIWRKPARSALTACSVMVGVLMLILMQSFLTGLDRAVIDGQIHGDTGHFRLMPVGYLETEEDLELGLSLQDVPRLLPKLQKILPEARLFPRLSFAAELSDGYEGLRARGMGIEQDSVWQSFRLPLEKELGSSPEPGSTPLWLGADLAKTFKILPGKTVTVMARTAAGSYTAQEFLVAGLIRSQNPAIDNMTFFIPLQAAQTLLDMPDSATEIVGLMPRAGQTEGLQKRLKAAGVHNLECQTWQEKAEPFLRVNRVRRKIFTVILGVALLIAASGIANTVVMSCFERLREIGSLRALGFQVEQLVSLLLLESTGIGMLGSGLGAGLGLLVLHTWRDGLDFSRFAASTGSSFSISTIIYLPLDGQLVLWAALLGVMVTILSSFWPALHFSRGNLLEAMHR